MYVWAFVGRVVFSLVIFSSWLALMWFMTWILVLRHVKFFREVVFGKNTPHLSPPSLPSLPQRDNSPLPHISLPSSPRIPPPLVLPPPILVTPANDPFYSLVEKIKLPGIMNAKKSQALTSPCHVPKFIKHWF